MKNKEAQLFAAELRTDLPTLDLHGLFPDAALERLELFLYEVWQASGLSARIIYGGGTGRLSAVILQRLQTHPLVDKIKELGGSCVILFND